MLRQVFNLTAGSSLGKLAGVAREIIFAGLFGTSAVADSYRAVLATAISAAHVIAAESLTAVFVPQFRRRRLAGDLRAWSLLNLVTAFLLPSSLVIAAVLYGFAGQTVSWLFPGFSGERLELAVRMLRITAWGIPPYILFIILISLESAQGSFRLSASRALVQNLGVIGAILVGFIFSKPVWIAWGFTATYLLLLPAALVWVWKRGLFRENWWRHWHEIGVVGREFAGAAGPLLALSVFVQGNLLAEKFFASLAGPGVLSALDYAKLLPETAQVLFAVPVGLVSLSYLAGLDAALVRTHSDNLVASGLLVFVPLSAFLFIAAPEVVDLVFSRGAFDSASRDLTSLGLRGLAVGVWASCLVYPLQKVCNAQLKNRRVLTFGLLAVTVHLLFNLMVYRYLGILGLGLGGSVASVLLVSLFWKEAGPLLRAGALLRILGQLLPGYLLGGWALNEFLPGVPPAGVLCVQGFWAVLFWGATLGMIPGARAVWRPVLSRLQEARRYD